MQYSQHFYSTEVKNNLVNDQRTCMSNLEESEVKAAKVVKILPTCINVELLYEGH